VVYGERKVTTVMVAQAVLVVEDTEVLILAMATHMRRLLENKIQVAVVVAVLTHII